MQEREQNHNVCAHNVFISLREEHRLIKSKIARLIISNLSYSLSLFFFKSWLHQSKISRNVWKEWFKNRRFSQDLSVLRFSNRPLFSAKFQLYGLDVLERKKLKFKHCFLFNPGLALIAISTIGNCILAFSVNSYLFTFRKSGCDNGKQN